MNKYRLWWIFPIVLVSTEPLRYFKDVIYPDLDPSGYPFISSDGVLNKIFAGYCFQLFFCLFLLINTFKYYLVKHHLNILPIVEQDDNIETDNQSDHYLSKHEFKKFSLVQLLKILAIYIPLYSLIVWFFGASIFEKIQYITGGECGSATYRYYRSCLTHGFKYNGGFKSSGHSLITSIFANSLIIEQLNLYYWLLHFKISIKEMSLAKLLLVISTTTSIIWIFMYSVTCLFYHTFMERVVGTFVGCFVFYIIYIKLRL